MAYKAWYADGVRLLHSHKRVKPGTVNEGGRSFGLLQAHAKQTPDSPNTTWRLSVECWVEEIEAVASDLDDLDQALLALFQVHKDLNERCGALMTLSYTGSDDRIGDVTTSYAAGLRAVVLTAPAGGWVPTADRYVLFRNKETGEGFVTLIVGWNAGTLALTANLPVAITADWEARPVLLYFTNARFANMDHGEAQDGKGNFRPLVAYQFEITSDPASAQAHYYPVL